MPMPSPSDDEGHDEWIDRCMANGTMNDEYPDDDQRLAVCEQIWDDDSEDNAAMSKPERRHVEFDNLEVREADDSEGPGAIEGHAAVFNEWTNIAGLFEERIAPGAFEESIESDDIRALFNHNPDNVLGRNKSGTLELSEDDTGLWMRVDLPDNSLGWDLRESVKRGDITGQSFTFWAEEEQWERQDDGLDKRTLLKVSTDDLGPVTYPAYEGTDVSASRARYQEWRDTEGSEQGETDEGEQKGQSVARADQRLHRIRVNEVKMNAP